MTETAPERLEHDWFDPRIDYPNLKLPGESCRRCGVMRGKVSETRECPGVVHVTLRHPMGQEGVDATW